MCPVVGSSRYIVRFHVSTNQTLPLGPNAKNGTRDLELRYSLGTLQLENFSVFLSNFTIPACNNLATHGFPSRSSSKSREPPSNPGLNSGSCHSLVSPVRGSNRPKIGSAKSMYHTRPSASITASCG